MNWKMTQDLCGEPMVEFWDRDGEDLTLGYSLLRALAAESGLVEIGPGVWRHSAEGVTWVPKGATE